MAFLEDLQGLLVNDPSIVAEYGTRIYFQLLPKNIDKELNWLRWGFTKAAPKECLGGGVAQQNYDVFIDVITRTLNDLPGMADEIFEQINGKTYEGIRQITLVSDSYSNYQEKDLYVNTSIYSMAYNK